jgi:hypothetical protein
VLDTTLTAGVGSGSLLLNDWSPLEDSGSCNVELVGAAAVSRLLGTDDDFDVSITLVALSIVEVELPVLSEGTGDDGIASVATVCVLKLIPSLLGATAVIGCGIGDEDVACSLELDACPIGDQIAVSEADGGARLLEEVVCDSCGKLVKTASILEVLDSEIAEFDTGSVVGLRAIVGDTVGCCSMCVVVAAIDSDVGKLGLLITKLLVPGAEICVVRERTNDELAVI